MATTRAPHRHHYVPRMVLRNFVNTAGGLHFWRRGMKVGDVRSTSPSNLFVEENLYTMVDADGEKDHFAEFWFARLESMAAPFLDQLMKVVRADMTPIFSREAWDFWHVYNYHAQKRAVAWHQRFLTREDLLSVMKLIATEEAWAEQERAWGEDPEKVTREMNNARIASQIDPIPDDLLEEFRGRGMVIYRAPPRSSFILGDELEAMAMISASGKGATARKVHFMPVAHDIAIGYSAARGSVHVDQLIQSDVRRMNEATTRQSYLIAGRSPALVASLSRVPYRPQRILDEILPSLTEAIRLRSASSGP